MNDQQKLQEMLEQATAPGNDLAPGLDPETASLREAWLALGRTLAAAEATAGAPRDLTMIAPPAPTRRRAVRPVSLLALAASLLIIASIAVLREPESNVADQGTSGSGRKGATETNNAADPVEEKSLTYWEWDEQIDAEIDNVARGANWRADYASAFSEAYSVLGDDILRIEEDINDGTF